MRKGVRKERVLQGKWKGHGIGSVVCLGYLGLLSSQQGFEMRQMTHCTPHLPKRRLRTLAPPAPI